ncbi:MAG: hypothetical protein ACYTG3_16745 [Planctomycetota bacterium]|jgi:hypothetical protein
MLEALPDDALEPFLSPDPDLRRVGGQHGSAQRAQAAAACSLVDRLGSRSNLFFDVNQKALEAPLEKKAGSMNVEVSQKKVKDKDGKGLADGWINFDLPVTVKVNGKVIIDRQVVERDWRSFWDTIVPKRFFMAPYLGPSRPGSIRFRSLAPGGGSDRAPSPTARPPSGASGDRHPCACKADAGPAPWMDVGEVGITLLLPGDANRTLDGRVRAP